MFYDGLWLESPPLCDCSRDSPTSCFLFIMLSFPSAPLLWPENCCANSWQFSENIFFWWPGTKSCFFSKDIEAINTILRFKKAFVMVCVPVSLVLGSGCTSEGQGRKQSADCFSNPKNERWFHSGDLRNLSVFSVQIKLLTFIWVRDEVKWWSCAMLG